jgi:lysophospholipase L1-like esterase
MDTSPTGHAARWLRIAVATATTVLALIACELGARLLLPAPPDNMRDPQIGYRADAEIRYVHVPSQRGWIDNGFVTINSLGFRGSEVVLPKPSGRFRVAVVGDSIAVGWGVGDDETFSVQLERLLRAKRPTQDVDVVDLGVSGYDTRQEVTLLKRNVARLQPDLVLVAFCSNDVPEALDDLQPAAVAASAHGSGGADRGAVFHINPGPSTWWERQVRRSRVLYATGRALRRLTGTGEWGRSRYSMELEILQGKSSPAIDRAWALVEGQLKSLKALGAARGFSVGVIVLPSREQVAGQFPDSQYLVRMRGIAERLGFFVVDPLPRLAHRDPKDQLYIPYDRIHPSALGHRIIADAIAADVVDRLTPEGAAPSTVAAGRISQVSHQ